MGNGYTKCEGSFLFLVENPYNDAPTCFELKDSKDKVGATFNASESGPCFGVGHDLAIQKKSLDTIRCYLHIGTSYIDKPGLGLGHSDFLLEDYEVWAVT